MPAIEKASSQLREHGLPSDGYHGCILFSSKHRERIESYRQSNRFGYMSFPGIDQDITGGMFSADISGKQILCIETFSHGISFVEQQISVFTIRTALELGITIGLLLGNAQALTGQEADVGIVKDQINLIGTNPLIGKNQSKYGPRFPDMTEAFNAETRKVIAKTFHSEGVTSRHGVLVGVPEAEPELGRREQEALTSLQPCFITTELIPEVIVAKHAQMTLGGFVTLRSATNGKLAGVLEKLADKIF